MNAQTIGMELAKLAFGLEQTHGEGFDRYFGMFVMAAGYVEAMQESGIEESARLAFDAQIARLGTE